METKRLERYLKSFAQTVQKESRGLLKAKKGDTKLGESIDFTVTKDSNGYSVKFYMNYYGTYLDKGVSGTKQVQKFKDYKSKIISSPYKYTTKQPPSGVLDKWVVKKGIAPRDEEGRFIKRKSLVFLIARKIKRDGIKGLSFFQKPLGLGLKQFGKGLLENVKEDIIEGLTQVDNIKAN